MTIRTTIARSVAAAAIIGGTVLTTGGVSAAAGDDATDDCELTQEERRVAHQLLDRSERLVDVAELALDDPTFAASVQIPGNFGRFQNFFDGASLCSLAMDNLAQKTADAADALAAYSWCMGEKIISDFTGGNHQGCDAEASHMRATAHEVEVAALNAEKACSTMFL